MKIIGIAVILVIMQLGNCQLRTFLDNFIEPFRLFRRVSARALGRDFHSRDNIRLLEANKKLQTYIDGPFPCNLTNTRSKVVPTSVHQLRPGDVDVIGALGDSITVGYGPMAVDIIHVLVEYRGLSPTMGGEGDWRTYLTLPNILKVFNPKLIGFALGTSLSIQRASQFNVAEGGAVSEEMPYMSKILVKRIKNDPRVNLKNDWKMITIVIGPNNFCTDICYLSDLQKNLQRHKEDMITVLRTLRDNLPRTIVNFVPPPTIEILVGFTNKSLSCQLAHKVECPCFFGLPNERTRHRFYPFMRMWQQLDEEIANLPEFDLEDFTVVAQPFATYYKFPVTEKGTTDYSFMSADCFHFSQKGNARVANSLWNNIMEPVGKKSKDGVDILAKFNCPTEEHPYIFTRRNSN